jgi:hypothetical protein
MKGELTAALEAQVAFLGTESKLFIVGYWRKVVVAFEGSLDLK